MPKTMSHINVIDVESTCWDNGVPAGQESEIIEIGISTIRTSDLWIDHATHVMVRPEYSSVSTFCTNLTGITREYVDRKGLLLDNAVAWMWRTFDTKSRIWASYGDYDRSQFQRDCKKKQVEYPFGSRHINVKTLFAIVYNLESEVGMDKALEIAGMDLRGRHHSGKDDAENIARILVHLIKMAREP